MRTNYMRELAQRAAEKGSVDRQSEDFVLDRLSKAQTKEYLVYLKRALAKKTLYVTSSTPIGSKTEKTLLTHFDKLYLKNIIDPKIGAGLVIKAGDDIIDMSIMGEIRRFIRTIA